MQSISPLRMFRFSKYKITVRALTFIIHYNLEVMKLTSIQSNSGSSSDDLAFVCPSCSAQNRSDAKFCRKCGSSRAALEVAASKRNRQSSTCSGCRQSVRVSDRFCWCCGTSQPFRISAHMKICRDCNLQMPDEAAYCSFCGNDVGASSDRQIPMPLEIFEDEDPDAFPVFEC